MSRLGHPEDCPHPDSDREWGLDDKGFVVRCAGCGLRGRGKTPPLARSDQAEASLDVMASLMEAPAGGTLNRKQGHSKRGKLSA